MYDISSYNVILSHIYVILYLFAQRTAEIGRTDPDIERRGPQNDIHVRGYNSHVEWKSYHLLRRRGTERIRVCVHP